jgi:hypothetical protein
MGWHSHSRVCQVGYMEHTARHQFNVCFDCKITSREKSGSNPTPEPFPASTMTFIPSRGFSPPPAPLFMSSRSCAAYSSRKGLFSTPGTAVSVEPSATGMWWPPGRVVSLRCHSISYMDHTGCHPLVFFYHTSY